MSKANLAFLFAGLLAAPILAQTPVQAFLHDAAAYPRQDHQLRRTVALVALSAQRLDELEAASIADAAAFRAVFEKQVRVAKAALDLLGTNGLEEVRAELAENLQRSFGAESRAFDRFMGVLAEREGRGIESGKNIRETVTAAVRALRSADTSKQPDVARLLTEAAAVVRFSGDDTLALQGICRDLNRL